MMAGRFFPLLALPVLLAVLGHVVPLHAADGYRVRSDDTVVAGELVWQQKSSARPMTHEQAISYCRELDLLGTGWRLPEREELQGLVDSGRGFPTIDTEVFPDTRPLPYWTATFDENFPGFAWSVGFGSGLLSLDRTDHKNFVRCVRRP